MAPKKKLVVVLGMHRSGTSAITRALKVMNVELGDQLPPPMEDNQKGFWEDVDINSLNIEMLNAVNSKWHYLVPIEPCDIETLIRLGYLLRATILLREKFKDTSIFGFKDPRVAKLLPFWQKVFEHCQFDVNYIIALRHPLSIARSLAARNGFDTEKSHLLWLGHVITSLSGSTGYKRVFIDYDRLMLSPGDELSRLAKYIDLDIDPTEQKIYIEEFLDQDLRNTVYNLNDLQLDETCPLIVQEIYGSLLAIASDKIKFDDIKQKKIPDWLNEFNRLKPALRLIDKLFTQKETATQKATTRDEQITELNQSLTNRDEQITELNQSLTNRDEQITELNQSLTNRDEQITELNQSLTNRDGQITELNQSLTTRDGQITELQSLRLMDHSKAMQLSDWAHNINAYPIRYGIKKHGLKAVKSIYHALPINLSYKHKFKDKVSWLLHASKNTESTLIPINNSEVPPCSMGSKNSLMFTNLFKGGLLDKQDIFIFSVIDWHFRIQRPQHLARSFARTGHRVFFFSNHFVDSSMPGYELEQLDPQLELYQVKLHVSGAPAIYFAPPIAKAQAMIEQSIAKLIIDFAAVSSVSIVQHAYWYPLVTRLPNTICVYDCMDHHEGFGNVPEELIEIEKKMLRDADLVIVTSTWLEEFSQSYNNNVVIIRNAGEYEHFSTLPKQQYIDTKKRKIIGYFGAIAEWFDIDLIRAVALAHPDALILLIGNDTVNAQKVLKSLTNVHFIGEIPYDQLPYYLHAFDVCLLPFRVIPLTLATNPVKVYEYLAASKPVVCVDLPEVAQFGDLVNCASDQKEFIRMVSDKLSVPDKESDRKLRREFAKEQTWDHRIETIEQAIQDTIMPKISVIVLTYNNLDLTKACLDSLLRWSDYPNMEIIVVDNASTDESPNYLRDFQEQHPQIKLLLNDKNLGFAAGNNIGLNAASGDYLVMLNNDTVVTPGWALTMLRHLQADSSIGLIGAVTNNIGNEAKINIKYSEIEEMLPLAMEYTTSHMGQHFPIRTAAFFCVMLPRKVFDQVGLLDENFGRGFFEDDDYCRRIEQKNLRIVCAEDVFIHHHLSASFNKLKQQDRQKLFEENKRIYEKKWGEWVPHSYRKDR